MRKRVLFRADAGPGVGLGHVMRCRTLGFELRRRGWIVGFMGSGIPDSFAENDRFDCLDDPYGPLRVGTLAPSHGRTLLETATRWSPDLLIVDHYGFSTDDFAVLCGRSWVLAAIDDLADRMLPVELVINPNPLASDGEYRRQGVLNALTGEAFTLIRPEILGRRRDGAASIDGPVVVSLGGGNVEAVLMTVLRAIPSHSPRLIHVVTSASCPNQHLRAWVGESSQTRCLHEDPGCLAELFSEAGIAITGGGGTLWEVYALGITSLAVVFVDNQFQTLGIVASKKTGFCVDLRKDAAMENVMNSLFALASDQVKRREMIDRQRKLIDGLGAVRVADRLEHICLNR
ncbi:MAG: hypothetical protein WA705_27940 [Candidatus Ozemobacteraceae bacterium]